MESGTHPNRTYFPGIFSLSSQVTLGDGAEVNSLYSSRWRILDSDEAAQLLGTPVVASVEEQARHGIICSFDEKNLVNFWVPTKQNAGFVSHGEVEALDNAIYNLDNIVGIGGEQRTVAATR